MEESKDSSQVRRYHQTLSDVKKLLGHCESLSASSQKFFRIAFQGCQPHKCICKDKNEETSSRDNAKGGSAFTMLTPCPKVIDSQTFGEWRRQAMLSTINRKVDGMRLRTKQLKLQLLPVGPFPQFVHDYRISGKSIWDLLVDFLRLFFTGCDVQLLPEQDISLLAVRKRCHSFTGKEQYLVGDFFTVLKRTIYKDALCIIALSWHDLYPCENLNFVLGQASFNHYCCVASFGRFDPTYIKGFKGNEHGVPVDQMTDIRRIDGPLLWKLLKVLTHETCHVFGLAHCGMFACLMNASSSSEEALAQPLVLCPLCMRKLLHACSTWPTTKNMFEVRSHLASISQFLSFVILPIIEDDENASDEMSSNTKQKVLDTTRWIDEMLQAIL